jgi:hypothetical protein
MEGIWLMVKLTIALLLLSFIGATQGNIILGGGCGRVFYVASNGNDANDGRSISSAWQTVAKVNSSTFSSGDYIRFRRGDTWREQLNIPSSGTTNHHIVFSAYGTGAKPIINGADVETGWTDAGSNQWYINSPNVTTTRAMVVIDGVIYREEASLAAVNAASEYFIDVAATPDRLYVYSTDDPDLHTAEVSNRDYCIQSNASMLRHHITIDNIEVRYAGRAGMYFEGEGSDPSNEHDGATLVTNCTAYANRLFGIANYDHHDNLTVEDCVATYNGNQFYSWQADEGTFRRCSTAHSIFYSVGANASDGHAFGGYQADNWLVENNYSDDDADAIHLDAGGLSVDAIIRYNKVFNSQNAAPIPTPGMGVGSVGVGGVVQFYYNLIVNCADAGFTCFTTINGTVQFYNNTIFLADGYGTDNGTFYLANGSNFDLKNNIFSRMGADSKTLLTCVASPAPTSNYNQWYQGPASGYRWFYNGNNYTSIALWRTGSSQDANSQSGDPLFVNQASDWSLQVGSPCRNTGTSVGLTQDINGNPIVGNPDIGCYEYQ